MVGHILNISYHVFIYVKTSWRHGQTCLVNDTIGIARKWSYVFSTKKEIIVKNMVKDMFKHVLTMFQMLTSNMALDML